ncbi:MAG TPA: hypothetical protein DD640_11005 [Clostridiales bacterium]|nr:hypothetical protein [Clostridiales bacterium]
MFRITQSCNRADEPDLTAGLLTEVRRRLDEYIYEVGPRSMPEVVKDLLEEKKLTIGIAESCTAGLAAAALTDIPGASKIFRGGVIAYDNQVKERILQVPAAIIDQYGAVSEECAVAMAKGCRNVINSDIAISITGIAGPDGGSPGKPVGLVWLAVDGAKGTKTRRILSGGNRARIRKVAVLNALDLARRYLIS